MKLLWIVGAITVAQANRPAGRPLPPTEVAIQGFGYKPKQLEITVGTRVVWTNADEIEHTVTAVADSGSTPLFNGDANSYTKCNTTHQGRR